MKILNIAAGGSLDGTGGTTVSVVIDVGRLDHLTALTSVIALFAGAPTAVSRDTQSPLAASASEATADTTPSTGRTRRSRSAAQVDPVAPSQVDPETTDAAPANVTDIGSRRSRRGTAPAAEPAPVTFTDADLSKAASHSAAAIVAAGFDGPGTVMDLMKEEFGVTDTREIPAERRPEFLKALADEVEASELEAKTAKA